LIYTPPKVGPSPLLHLVCRVHWSTCRSLSRSTITSCAGKHILQVVPTEKVVAQTQALHLTQERIRKITEKTPSP
jgi:hypothetical protein